MADSGRALPAQRIAFASMCIRSSGYHVPGSRPGHNQPHVFYERCAASACSLLRWPSVQRHPIVYLVDDALPASLRRAFSRNAISLLNVSIGAWPATPRYPRAPPRAYSFHKLALWRLGAHFDRVVFYDSDAFFANDPAKLLRITNIDTVALWATRMPAPPSKWKKKADAHVDRYFNSGLMVFRPSDDAHALILRALQTDAYRLYAADERDVGDQDVLIEVFSPYSTQALTRLRDLDGCANFRHARRVYQRRCEQPAGRAARFVNHGTYHFDHTKQAASRRLTHTSSCTRDRTVAARADLGERPQFVGSIDLIEPAGARVHPVSSRLLRSEGCFRDLNTGLK